MKSKQLYFYLGIILIVLPFLGFYQYLKNSIYIVIGVALIVNSRSVGSTTPKPNARAQVRKPAIRRTSENLVDIQKEKEL